MVGLQTCYRFYRAVETNQQLNQNLSSELIPNEGIRGERGRV
jgi:hypothetical protein